MRRRPIIRKAVKTALIAQAATRLGRHAEQHLKTRTQGQLMHASEHLKDQVGQHLKNR